MQVLTNAALTPELTQTSLATQRFAIALSLEWVVSAYRDFTVSNRAKVPHEIELTIDDWQGVSTDGSNERELIDDVEAHYERREREALAKVKIHPLIWAYLTIGALVFVPALFAKNYFMMAVGAGGGVAFAVAKQKNNAIGKRIANDCTAAKIRTQQQVRASLAEIVDWRRDYADCDGKEANVTAFLGGIEPEQYILNPHGQARRVVVPSA